MPALRGRRNDFVWLGGGCLFWSQDEAWGCLFPEGYLGEWGGTDRDTHTWGCALWVDAEAVLCATGAVMHSGGGVKLLSPPPPLIWAQPQFSRSRKLRRGETESTVTPPPPSVCMCVCGCMCPPLQADKRAHHNALERKRRDHIKDSFHSLRDSVPSLQGEKVRLWSAAARPTGTFLTSPSLGYAERSSASSSCKHVAQL